MGARSVSENAVYIRNMHKGFVNGPSIIENLSMTVEKATIYGLLGASGSGKTTLLSCMVGLAKWDSGEILVFGQKPGSNEGGKLEKRIGYMPQESAMCNLLSIWETVLFYGRLYNMTRLKITEEFNKLTDLLDLPHQYKHIGDLSGGEKRRTSLALALIHSPKLVILDEPTVGLDPLLRIKIWEHLSHLVQNFGSTIIITTHYTEEARLANTIGVIRNGRILVEESPSRLLQVHNCDLLEQAILKLCKIDDSKRNAGSGTSFNIPFDILDSNIFSSEMGTVGNCSHGKFDKLVVRMNESLHRIYGMTAVLMATLRSYPLAFLLILILPSTQAIVSILVMGKMPRDMNLGIINSEAKNWTETCTISKHSENSCDFTQLSCKFIQELTMDGSLILTSLETQEEALEKVHSGNLIGYLTIPKNYSQDFMDYLTTTRFAINSSIEGSRIHVYLDHSQYMAAAFTIKYLLSSYLEYLRKLALSCNLGEFETSFLKFRKPIYGDEKDGYTDFMIPGIMLIVLLTISTGITALLIISDRKEGVFNRMQVAGISPADLMISHLASQAIIIVAQILVLSGVLHFLFGYFIHGNLGVCFIICLITGLCGTIIGIFLGIVCNNEVQAVAFLIFVYPLLLLLSGAVWPAENIINLFKYVGYILPNTVITASLRSVIIRGWGITHPIVLTGLVAIFSWIVVASIFCWVVIRKILCKQ